MDILNINSPTLLLILLAIGIVCALLANDSKASPSMKKKMYHQYIAFVDKTNKVITSIGETKEEMNEKIFVSEEDTKEAKKVINEYSYVYGDLKYHIERMEFGIEKGNVKIFKKAMNEASSILDAMKGYSYSLRSVLSRMRTVSEYAAQQEAYEDPYDARCYMDEDDERGAREYKEPSIPSPFSLNTSLNIFFSGCNDIEAIEKRYKSLAKVYHPDMPTGDEETFKMMREEYERVKVSQHIGVARDDTF